MPDAYLGVSAMNDYNDLKMRTLQFLVTEDCNLKCVYCYEKNKNTKSLSADFMIKRIREEMLADNDYEELSIDFFGGEPLLEFGKIKKVVEWFHQYPWPANAKAYRFLVTTNGTILNEEMKEWFSRNRDDVTVGLSMDGTPEAQNRNRSNSYDDVAKHIPFFKELWPDQSVKMTSSLRTLDQIYEGVRHIDSLGLPVEPTVVFEDIWGNEADRKRAWRTYAEQLDKVVWFYHTHPEAIRPVLLFRDIQGLYTHDDPKEGRLFCGAGRHLVCYAADEGEYPCMRFAPISTTRPLHDVTEAEGEVNEECEQCALEKLCPTCQAYNYEINGSSFARTSFHCEFFKLELLASAKLCLLDEGEQLHQVNEGDASDSENMARLRKLLAIQTIDNICAPLLDS